MRIRMYWLLALALTLLPRLAAAQIVTQPQSAHFTHDMVGVISVHLNFYQCTGFTGTGQTAVGTGCAATPFQTGVDIPAASVALLNPVDQFGNNRAVSLVAAPVNTYLSSTPLGVPFVAAMAATGDPNAGLGVSPVSAVSNPFFPGLRAAAAPAGVHLF